MSYHKQETKHKEVCAVWGKTGQTGFRNWSDQFHPVSPQNREDSETNSFTKQTCITN
jgi:hypothetical protein